ncbi:MAG: MFS transporter [Parvularculaceae bacterium]
MPIEPAPSSSTTRPRPPPRATGSSRSRAASAGSCAQGMGRAIVFAVLPPLARNLGLADIGVGFIFLFSSIFWVFLSPRWGGIPTGWGEALHLSSGCSTLPSMVSLRPRSSSGLAGVLGGTALPLLLIATRSIYGLIGSAMPSAAQGYIADRTPPKQRTAGMAGFSAAFGLGAMLGPGLGGAAAAIGPLAPLYAVSALAGVMVVILYFLLPEKTAPTPRTPRIQLRLGDRRLRPFLIFGLMFGVINAVPIQTTAFYFIDVLKFDPSVATQFAGIGLMAASMASLFSQLVLVQRFNVQPNILMRVAPALMISGHTLIIFSTDFGPMVFGLMLSGLGAGMAIPGYSAAASLSVGPDEQGAAAGLANSAGASGFIVAPIAAFGLYSVAPQAPYLLTATMAGALLAFALTSRAIRAAGVTAAAN